jgi:hypothetical protein
MSHTSTSSLESPRLTSAQAAVIITAVTVARDFPRIRHEAREDAFTQIQPFETYEGGENAGDQWDGLS